jgi:hypothetical protein
LDLFGRAIFLRMETIPSVIPSRYAGLNRGGNHNPNGSKAVKMRITALNEELRAEFGSLDRIDNEYVKRAAELLVRSEWAKPNDKIRMVGTAHRLLETVRRHAAKSAPKPGSDLTNYLNSEIAAKAASETE